MVELTGESLTITDVVKIARGSGGVALGPGVWRRLETGRAVVEQVVQGGRPVYGVNTGFGALCNTVVASEDVRKLQLNLVRSHASGVGDYFPPEVVRAAILVRLNSLCRGNSGVRPAVVDTLVRMLERGVTPAVPCQGSLGASGDLAPLAHVALVVTGEGKAWLDGELLNGTEALRRAGIEPVELDAKEGLALLNGTAFMTAIACLACHDALRYLEVQDAAAALSFDAFRGDPSAFSAGVLELRGHRGAVAVGKHLRALLAGSRLTARDVKPRVQDPYSFRCIPQVHGAAVEAVMHASQVVSVELNSVTDNPLVVDGEVFSGGNFHGQPVGAVMDYLAIALTPVAAMAERRINQLLHPAYSGLPAFLVPKPGLNSGLMIAQYTAASLVNESRVLSTPASVQSIPVCADQEDHVSMATFAASKAQQVVRRAILVAAVELLAAAQAVDLRVRCLSVEHEGLGGQPAEYLGAGTRVVYQVVRQAVPFLQHDTPLTEFIERLGRWIEDGKFSAALSASGLDLPLEEKEPREPTTKLCGEGLER